MVDHAVLGSIEFGVVELKIPLLMVPGHKRCGAVKATMAAVEKHAEAPGDIETLVEAIRPAVEMVKGRPGDLLDNAVKANIELTVKRLKGSPLLAEAVEASQLKIVGALYDSDIGSVGLIVF